MARKSKKIEGAMGDGMLDLRHTGVTRLNNVRRMEQKDYANA